MSLFKREKTWWTDFSINGVRYRMSLDTTDWREAQSREKEKITQASMGKLAPSSQQFARLAFIEAADRYVESRKLELAPRSVAKERELLRAPGEYFHNTSLHRITVEDLWAYREKRAAEGKAAVYINMEVGAIRRLLKRAKRWHLLAADIKPLKERHREARVLSPDQKLRLARLAGSRPDWQIARLAMILAFNTTMRGCEIRGLCWRDVDFIERTLTIRRSKTEAGQRVIPLNADAWAAVLELRERALTWFGELCADWFLFPHGEGRVLRPDPTQPMKGWRTAWRSLTRAIECPVCGQLQAPAETCANDDCKADIRGVKSHLHGLRFHDLRHHAITELAESLTSEQTIMAIAGHVSPRMLAHYSHVRLDAKRRALDALGRGVRPGVMTQTASRTSQNTSIPNRQVIEKIGGPGLTRTTDLTLIRGAL
jgi:integrase